MSLISTICARRALLLEGRNLVSLNAVKNFREISLICDCSDTVL